MLNLLLNRYYLNNAGRSVLSAETQARVQSLLSQPNINTSPASAAGKSVRGREQHEGRRQELQGLWKRQLDREEGHTYPSDNFCTKH